MKKLFFVLAVASLGFVACNNEAEGDSKSDSLTAPDVTPPAAPLPDSLGGDTSNIPAPDTTVTP